MKIERVSAFAEIVASVAIVVTLVYLAIQTNQNTEAVRAAIRQGMVASELQLLLSRADNPARLMSLCKQEISPEEGFAAQSDIIALIRMREHDWLQLKYGNLDEQTWESYRGALAINLGHPRIRQFWDQISAVSFDPEFVTEINELLSDSIDVQAAAGLCNPLIN